MGLCCTPFVFVSTDDGGSVLFVQPQFGYQPQIIRPGGPQIPNYIGYPNVPLRQGQQGQRAGGRRGGAPQQQPQQQQQVSISTLSML